MGLTTLGGIGMPNPTSYTEKTRSLIFPATPEIQNEIPLYLKLTAVEYSQNGLMRSGSVIQTSGGFGNVKAHIAVPVPTKLTTQTAMRYKNQENTTQVPIGDAWIKDKVSGAGKAITAKIEGIIARGGSSSIVGKGLEIATGALSAAFNQLIDSDFTETILESGSKRSFIISLYLPCLSEADSVAAANISRAFEALALPTMIGASVLGVPIGTLLTFHPPMWFFGVGGLNSVKNDIDWTSQPQASVLTNVAVNRVAIDSSSFSALDLNIKPVAYSITLNYTEIEPAYRATSGLSETSFEITNRSGGSRGFGLGAKTGI